MLALQLTALAFLLLSAALMFGPQLVAYGPRALPVMMRHRQVRFIGGFLTSVAALAVMAPQFGTALTSGSQAMTLVMIDVFTMSFGLI